MQTNRGGRKLPGQLVDREQGVNAIQGSPWHRHTNYRQGGFHDNDPGQSCSQSRNRENYGLLSTFLQLLALGA